MPYLKGSKLTDEQCAPLGMPREYIDGHVWFVCNDGSVSRRHVPRRSPIDDHDIEVLLTALRHYEASPWRDMLGPENTTSDHVAAITQYLEDLRS